MVSHDALIDLSSEQSLKAADDVLLGESFLSSSAHVGNGWLVILHSDDDGSIERRVGLAVSAPKKPVLVRETRRSGDGANAAEFCERRLRVDALRVVAKDDEHLGSRVGSNAEPSRSVGPACSVSRSSSRSCSTISSLRTSSVGPVHAANIWKRCAPSRRRRAGNSSNGE